MGDKPAPRDPRDYFEFTPVEGRPNIMTLRIVDLPPGSENREMTDAEWDKFERDCKSIDTEETLRMERARMDAICKAFSEEIP